jgi:hypothetical protein
MLAAIELVKDGASAYRAARETGISSQAIYMSRLYAEVMAERESRGLRVRRSPFRTRP